MTAVGIVAFGAISALGEGAAAVSAGESGAAARVAIQHDDELARAGLSRPFVGRVHAVRGDDRAAALLARALVACGTHLDATRPGWRRERLGLVLGTSSGGMRSAETAFATLARGDPWVDAEGPTYYGPMARAARVLRMPLDPAVLVLGACASASLAIGLAMRWLERDSCDLVLAGGFDEVTIFVAAGFEALRAVTASPPPRPFRQGRDGMALGEGAAVVALAKVDARPAIAVLRGFGAASDAVHLTAPDREGAGLGRAAAAAFAEAGRPPIDLVSAHATATPLNDAAEFRALERVLGAPAARDVVAHAFKAQIGHTLGAGGALELLACVDAMTRGLLPASAGAGILDPEAPAHLLELSRAGAPKAVLKLTSAFGGANAALVVGGAGELGPAGSRGLVRRRAAHLHAAVHVDREPTLEALAASTGLALDRVARGDGLVRFALASVAELTARCGSLAGAAIVVGSAFSTIETNAVFAARIRERGATAAEPRRFPYTSPNAVAGECSMAFGLRGPNFTTGGGLHAALEALACAAVLIEGGDAEDVVVVAVDEAGPVTQALAGAHVTSGAVALLLSAVPTRPGGLRASARVGRIQLRRGDPAAEPRATGHRALVPLVRDVAERRRPSPLVGTSPPDMFARIDFEAV